MAVASSGHDGGWRGFGAPVRLRDADARGDSLAVPEPVRRVLATGGGARAPLGYRARLSSGEVRRYRRRDSRHRRAAPARGGRGGDSAPRPDRRAPLPAGRDLHQLRSSHQLRVARPDRWLPPPSLGLAAAPGSGPTWPIQGRGPVMMTGWPQGTGLRAMISRLARIGGGTVSSSGRRYCCATSTARVVVTAHPWSANHCPASKC